MTAMLASVRNRDEAELAAALGADLVDLKDPAAGALGALPLATIRAVVHALHGRRPASATLGDLPMEPATLAAAAAATAAAGVDYVKVGLFAHRERRRCIDALAPLARRARLIGVFFADEPFDMTLLDALAAAGFAGAMLDTAAKGRGGLRAHRSDVELGDFVRRARALGLLTGLAGSLGLGDIAPLAALRPDYLGFRTALCRRGVRGDALDPRAFAAVRARLDACSAAEAGARSAS
ncbi:MAG TPA: (5-formylfuran-3-yl)methyl phosphate synthase [Sandaracinaceae bacterium]